MTSSKVPLRIIIVCDVLQGTNSYAFARAFRRLGHSVTIVSEELFMGVGWKGFGPKVARRLLKPTFAKQFSQELMRLADELKPHLLFVCKGILVTAETVRRAKAAGAVTVNFWPDVSFLVDGPNIPRALPCYDWVFTTKTFGVGDMRKQLGVTHSSFMPHGYDPETHRIFSCDADDVERYSCDVSFVGAWTPKKQLLLEELVTECPELDLKIWGQNWEKAGPRLAKYLKYRMVFGVEYAKALHLSKINLGLLHEVDRGASKGDQITSRTFHIPASGGFMLHERTDEVQTYFIEGKECALFEGAGELASKIKYYSDHPDERDALAKAGHHRCLISQYSIDDRAESVLAKYAELRARSIQ